MYKDQHGNIYTKEQYDFLTSEEMESLEMEPCASSIAVFFGGMTVGWIVDGVIQYTTGKAPSEWVALGLQAIERKIRKAPKNVKFVKVYSNGDVAYCYQGGCQVSW